MADVIYNKPKLDFLKGDIDLLVDTIKVMLVGSGYTPNQDTHDFINDVSAQEITGEGYTAGGATLGTKTVTQDDTNNRAVFDAANVVWANSTITAYGAVFYKDSGDPATSPVLFYKDFGGVEESADGNFTLNFSADGIFYLG